MVPYSGQAADGRGGRGGTLDTVSSGGGDNMSLHCADRYNYSNGVTTTPQTNGGLGHGMGNLAGRLNGACFPLYRNNNQEVGQGRQIWRNSPARMWVGVKSCLDTGQGPVL